MDGSTTRATKHDGICRDTRCIIRFSFYFVSVFNLSSTLRCLCSRISSSPSHYPYLSTFFFSITLPLPTRPYTNRHSSFSTFHVEVPFSFLLPHCQPGMERNPQRYQDGVRTSVDITCWGGSGRRDPTRVAQATGSRPPFSPTGRGVDQDKWMNGLDEGPASKKGNHTVCLADPDDPIPFLSLQISFSLGFSRLLLASSYDSRRFLAHPFVMSYLGIPLETTGLSAWCVFNVSWCMCVCASESEEYSSYTKEPLSQRPWIHCAEGALGVSNQEPGTAFSSLGWAIRTMLKHLATR
jgi:hypothetical protein